uniref:Leucine rich repeat and sterile alpha motif containing 1 n=1 Tax=Cyprinus carpio TaxID=7962 RepID=A0A8C1TLU6_CYPCA
MFLFSKKKKPSEDSIKRLEYQLCLAKEAGADDILDISACELAEVLDLHENKLTSLPDDIGQLLSLQVLNVEKNHIKQLPDSIGDLRHLQTLNVKGNSLTVIPVSVGRMSSLRTLDISENSITELPKELANVRTLESLILDAQVMRYPPASVCTAGTEEVQRYLCSGTDYCPPSQYLLPVLEDDGGKQEVDCVDGEEMAWQSKFMDYEKRKVQKHLEKVIFEKDLEEKQREHTQLLLLNNSRKEDVLLSVKLEQQRLELGVSQQQRAQETERQKMLDKARLAESNIMSRISDLLLDNKRMLSESYSLRLLQEAREAKTQILVSETCRSLDYMDRKFDQVLSLQQLDKSKAISQILQEVLADQRTALSDILQQLLKQKDQREEELRMVLVEMEQKSESNQQNYWMIQYQRLLDAKPLSLRMQEAAVDADLGNLLCKLSAQHYLPIIAHQRITAEALRHMTTKDLRKVRYISFCVLAHRSFNAPLQQELTPPLTPSTPLTPTAPSPDRWSSSECVVCMEHESQVIFLPCGHVCCCQTCSDALQSCPMCRGTVSQRVRLYHG